MRQDLHELTEIDPFICALLEEGMYYSLAQRINGQLGYSKEILAREGATVAAVQRCEAGVQALYLIRSDWEKTTIEVDELMSINLIDVEIGNGTQT